MDLIFLPLVDLSIRATREEDVLVLSTVDPSC
jgi:hypothetical protein